MLSSPAPLRLRPAPASSWTALVTSAMSVNVSSFDT
jgi:hypothetical protein